MKKNKKEIILNGEIFDSRDELFFYQWLLELQKHGVVNGVICHPNLPELLPAVKIKCAKMDKKVVKVTEMTLTRPATYTPDFLIYWCDGFRSIIYEIHNELNIMKYPTFFANKNKFSFDFTLIDCKPNVSDTFLKYGSSRVLSLQQKILYNKHKLFVQKIHVFELFEATFWPVDLLIRRQKTAKNKRSCREWIAMMMESAKYDFEKVVEAQEIFEKSVDKNN